MSTQDVENVKQVQLDFDAECPSCSASIEFNPSTGKLTCPYCGFETEIATPDQEEQKVAQEMDFFNAEERGNFNWGVEKKRSFVKPVLLKRYMMLYRLQIVALTVVPIRLWRLALKIHLHQMGYVLLK